LSIKISLYILVADKKSGRGDAAADRYFHAQILARSASDEFVNGPLGRRSLERGANRQK
jgi:hypothetical protein